jgi:hypothetical protein
VRLQLPVFGDGEYSKLTNPIKSSTTPYKLKNNLKQAIAPNDMNRKKAIWHSTSQQSTTAAAF